MSWREEYGLPERPARDAVPGSGLTLEGLRELNDAVMRKVETREAGELVADVDGMPSAVAPTEVTADTVAAVAVGYAELRRLGGRPEDYPRVTFLGEDPGPAAQHPDNPDRPTGVDQ